MMLNDDSRLTVLANFGIIQNSRGTTVETPVLQLSWWWGAQSSG